MKIIVNIMLCASCALAALRGSAVPPRETKPTNLLNGWKAPERAVNAHGRVLLQPGETEITGIANSLMEDHFDVGAHFAWTIVTADSGETFKIDTPHGERYKSTPVRWIVREKSQDEIRSSRQQHQQHFAEQYVNCVKALCPISGRCRAIAHNAAWICCVYIVLDGWYGSVWRWMPLVCVLAGPRFCVFAIDARFRLPLWVEFWIAWTFACVFA